MKTNYGIILVLTVTAGMLFIALPCGAVEKNNENIWQNDKPAWERKGFELTNERVERIMSRLAEINPEKAEELARLREKDPKKFKVELRKAVREQIEKRFEGRMERGAGRGPRRGEREMPFIRPGGPGERGGFGEPGGGPKREMFRDRLREKHDEYLEWLEKNYPEEAEKLAELREKKPELYMRQIGLSLKKYGRIAKAAKENPELAEALKKDLKLKKKRDKLLRKIRAAGDEDEKKELIEDLEGVVSRRFDLIVKQKQAEYEHLRKKLEELKEQVSQRRAEVEKWKDVKNEKVKERTKELISQTEKFNWH